MITQVHVPLVAALSVFRLQAPQAEPPVGPSTALQRRAAPPARILEFRAQPESIMAGESVTLIWATENPDSVTITPEKEVNNSLDNRSVQ